MAEKYSAGDILHYLDNCLAKNSAWSFIDLGHPYVYTANSRLTLYADDARWALVSEVSGYNPRADRFALTLTWFGNTLRDLPTVGGNSQFTSNVDFVTLSESMSAATQHFAKSAAPADVLVRDQTLRVPSASNTFGPNVASRPWPQDARTEDIGRHVAYEYAEICRARDAEKRARLPVDVPELMTIDEWHHRPWHYLPAPFGSGAKGDAPSSYETYRLIAAVLAEHNPLLYQPTLRPNSHWSNWPQAGSL